ncbi:MAG: cytochrome ubiquinol oxidase subunit I [Gammaproteobacteria bacterium]|nr:cytochrome ubiquinol oxidase subunit I [Gammaproteobacteria bacterium]MBU2024001.1 cytochrome ubiquinol oxidase subunit I [Gammaproteobacteria bacterium]MBU2240187.1 cytochrome ubiquinol oxidase subunit I [Gammaproteobacteria bacterium]MBU2415082.1 cytochrome ubiquinol oxidase subunit I [Gammaproteobacteria bacterium]
MDLDVAILSRIQFAFTVSFHIIFPSITIGLATLIAIWEGLWLKTHNPYYLQLAKFWIKPFAITFGMGVVSGIVLSYEFGTNFSKFSEITGAVLGPLMAYEVLTAFFMEAGFLGVMLFGWQRVGRKLHFFATLTVMIGTWISAFWIIVANSWMQTPTGYKIINGKFEVESWMEVIFNPSMPYRLTHMVVASLITATFVVAGISAYYLLKKKNIPFAKKGLSMCMWFALVLTPLQAWIGDMHGLNVREHQPTKLAAMEGIWPAEEENVPLLLFAMPNMQTESNDYEVGIPNLGSLILTHSWDGAVQGLEAVPPEDRPNVPLVFWSFRVMVGIGFGMMGIAALALLLRRKGRLYENKAFLSLVTLFTPMGVIAVLAGWYVVEIGRQPWIVYNLVRTSEIVSPLPPERVLFTLTMFVIIYSLLIGVYLYFMRKLIKKGPPSMETLEQQLIGMKAPGYALAWVKSLKTKEQHSTDLKTKDQSTIEQGDK